MATYDPFASLASSQPSTQPVTPVPTVGKQQQSASRPLPSADPFAILSNPTPRQPSPFEYQQQSSNRVPSASPSLFDFAQSTKPQTQPNQPALAAQQNNGTSSEEEWTFASSLPDQANLPPVNEVMVTNTAVNVVFAVSRPAGDDSSITMVVRSSNNTAQPIAEFTFQIAVPKVSIILVTNVLGIQNLATDVSVELLPTTNAPVRAKSATTSTERDNATDTAERRRKRQRQHGQDALEGLVQSGRGIDAGRAG